MYGYGCFISANGKPPSAGGFDADAQSFFAATGITNLTQKNAVNQLVLDLKSNSLWTKMKALYPVVGGNATAHSYNLINTAQYQLSFSSGWTHSSNGMTPNGTSAYADTNLTARGLIGVNSTHISYYSRTNAYGGVNQAEIGTNSSSNTDNLYITYDLANNAYLGVNQFGDSTASRLGNTLGHLLLTRTTSTGFNRFFNSSKTSITSTSTNTPNTTLVVGASRNGASIANFSTKQCAFVSIGDGLNDTESSTFYTIIQAFQTTLSRQV